ncbi:aldehyde dehydrogenase family 8 member A1-like protein [Dinothrombium tinctorium]|uniref:Aldehyde dehydrogenase family 8 member A1-like protein n=2 Tax=Dinothrombium tinctorium TaxID=1965070 RepID=A0A3S3P0N9_9ACAR|nr:aldehyde dehydrogenase family 8 member A1-like protein [Dinothrombium tinctorium]
MSALKVVEIKNYINGRFVPSEKHFESLNPATTEVCALIPDSDENEIDEAVDAAKKAFAKWSQTAVKERSYILFKIADLIEAKANELALLESMEQGKPLWLAETVDIPRAVLNFRHFATTVQSDSELAVVSSETEIVNYTLHEPIGVAGIITPWNLPLYLLTFKLAPALAYGNTVVAKPSELTSVTAFKLCEIMEEAGMPSGVVNIVFGYGNKAGKALVKHDDVKLISFTGSTATGTHIMQESARMAKKLSLEMGGKNAAIVFKDVNLQSTIPNLIRSCFLNQGEVCLSSSKIYVEKEIYDDFVELFVTETKKLKVGNPLSSDTFIGALISKDHLEKVKSYVKIAESENAEIKCGGIDCDFQLDDHVKNGFFFAPTVITNINESSRCMKEEIFGPVVCITHFESEEDVIKRANDVKYGLSATVWTQNVNKLLKVAHQLKVGTVWCNCWLVRNLHMPFGGMKMSGIGREGTQDSREFYTEKKTICIKLSN